MKAVILCGGRGTRLSGETEFTPKPLVKIGGKPILWHIMKIFSHQGVKEFILCLGYRGEMIKEYFLNLEEMSNDFSLDLRKNKIHHLSDNESGLDVVIHFVDTGQNAMTGARVAKIKKYIGEDENFFLTYGDGVSDVNLNSLFNHHKRLGVLGTITAVKPSYRFGLVETQDGRVLKFDEKPDMKDTINGGFMVFNKKIFDLMPGGDSFILETDLLPKLTSDGQLGAYHHKGYWQCMDDNRDLGILNKACEMGAPWAVWEKEKNIVSKGLEVIKREYVQENKEYSFGPGSSNGI